MQPAFPYHIKGQHLWLSPDRCLYWEEEKALIVSDLHFGKTGHFRKAGIAVPQSVYREDLLRLLCQIQYFQPRQLLVVGDLFHSRENKELNLFRKWRDDFPDLRINLIEGNHDILHEDWYAQSGITLCPGLLKIGPFGFVHDITEMQAETVVCRPLPPTQDGWSSRPSVADAKSGPLTESQGNPNTAEPSGDAQEPTTAGAMQEPLYYFSGHIHPGIRINGMGRQALQFPCFYFGSSYAILPAFGKFTGTVSIDVPADANVFAILPPAGHERGGHFFQRRPLSKGPAGRPGIPGESKIGNTKPGSGHHAGGQSADHEPGDSQPSHGSQAAHNNQTPHNQAPGNNRIIREGRHHPMGRPALGVKGWGSILQIQ